MWLDVYGVIDTVTGDLWEKAKLFEVHWNTQLQKCLGVKSDRSKTYLQSKQQWFQIQDIYSFFSKQTCRYKMDDPR